MPFLEVAASGLILGSGYAIMAAGLALAYSVSRIFNWAYGSLFTWAGLVAWGLTQPPLSLPYVEVAVLIVAGMFVVGYATERLMIRRLRRRRDWQMDSMLATLGLALLLDNLGLLAFGAERKALPIPIPGSVELFGISFAAQKLVIVGGGVLIVLSLTAFLRLTKLGMSIRAVTQDATGSAIVGIPVKRVFGTAMGLSGALVGIAAMLILPLVSVSTEFGWQVLIKAFVVVAFAGMGNVMGVLYAALLLGFLEALVGWQFGYLWVYVFWLGLFLLIVAFRPHGLLPSRSISREA